MSEEYGDLARRLANEQYDRQYSALVESLPESRLSAAVRTAFGDVARMCEPATVEALAEMLARLQAPTDHLPLAFTMKDGRVEIICTATREQNNSEPCVWRWHTANPHGSDAVMLANGRALDAATRHATERHTR